MPITERTLRKWRREALQFIDNKESFPTDVYKLFEEGARRILKMTQELLDQHLIRKE